MRAITTLLPAPAWMLFAGVLMSGCSPAPTEPEASVLGAKEGALPAPTLDVPASNDSFQTAVFAGGCFWSVELVFEHVNGVVGVTTGYSGGLEATARYDLVAIRQTTDHAEVVEVSFDPAVVSYGDLLRVFFSVVHDPTQIDQQFPDFGREYRSHIFYKNESQRQVAEAYIDQLDASGSFEKPIVTRVDALHAVYRAEEQHQDFAVKNVDSAYVLIYSFPKVAKLATLLPNFFHPDQSG